MWVCGAASSWTAAVRTGEHSGHDARARARARDEVAHGVARDGHVVDRLDLEAEHRGQDHVGSRSASTRVRR